MYMNKLRFQTIIFEFNIRTAYNIITEIPEKHNKKN